MQPAARVVDLERADPDMRGLGPVAAERARVARMGIPSPPAFLVAASRLRDAEPPAETVPEALRLAVSRLETATGSRLGADRNPLFLRVSAERKAAGGGWSRQVVDGVGFAREPAAALVAGGPDRRQPMRYFARFLRAYGEQVLGIEADRFERQAARVRMSPPAEHPSATVEEQLAKRYLWVVQEGRDRPFPYDAMEQLYATLRALAGEGSPDAWLLVEASVPEFAHRPSGRCVTRDPATGVNRLHGWFLPPGGREAAEVRREPIESLPEHDLEAHTRLMEVRHALEHGFGEPREFDFATAFGRLLCTASRPATLAASARLVIAADMVRDGGWRVSEALERVSPADVAEAQSRDRDRAGPALADLLAAVPSGALPGASVRVAALAGSAERLTAALAAGAGAAVCPTEALFDTPERRRVLTELAMAGPDEPAALSRLLAAHRADLRRLLEAGGPSTVTFRLLSRPAADELSAVQIRAILEAVAGTVQQAGGGTARVLVPGVDSRERIRRIRDLAESLVDPVGIRYGVRLDLELGAVVDSVLGCLAIPDVAEHVRQLVFDLAGIDHALHGERAPDPEAPRDGTRRLVTHAALWALEARPDVGIAVQADAARLEQACEWVSTLDATALICGFESIGPARLGLARAALRARNGPVSVGS